MSAEDADAGRAWDIGLRIAVTAASAAFLAMLSAPANWHWFQWVAYLPFFWVLREDTPKANRWYAFLYGTVAVAVIFRWIPDTISIFSNVPRVGALLLWVIFSMGFGLPYLFFWSAVHPLRKRIGDGWVIALPAWLVVVEFLSMYALLFPYQQGVAQFGNPFTIQLASATGIWGLSFLVLLVNSAIAEGIYREREGRPFPVRWVCASIIAVSCVIFYGAWRFERIEAGLRIADTLRVQQIQLDTTMQHRLSASREEAVGDWLRETSKVRPGTVDLVVWSEGASPFNVHEGPTYKQIGRLARRGKFEIIVGGGTVHIFRDERGQPIIKPNGSVDYEAFNSIYLFGNDGKIDGRYDKTEPLPFGEYLPLSGVFPWLADMIEGPGNFKAGATTNNLDGDSISYAAPICYEAILPGICRAFPNPDLLVNLTNDAWFSGPATYQHGMLAAIRATELGVPLFRAAYTGTSFVVEPHGHIYARTEPFVRVNRPVAVRMGHFTTIYGRFGDWFVFLCMGGLVITWLIAPWRAYRRTGATPVPSGVRSSAGPQ